MESEHEMTSIDDDPDLFGDSDPEDAWDDGDPVRVRLAILERILDHLREHEEDERRAVRKGIALGLIVGMVHELQEDTKRLKRIRAAFDKLED